LNYWMLMRYFYSIQMDKAYKQQIEPYFADKIFRLHVSTILFSLLCTYNLQLWLHFHVWVSWI
jgi:hypothetical protein